MGVGVIHKKGIIMNKKIWLLSGFLVIVPQLRTEIVTMVVPADATCIILGNSGYSLYTTKAANMPDMINREQFANLKYALLSGETFTGTIPLDNAMFYINSNNPNSKVPKNSIQFYVTSMDAFRIAYSNSCIDCSLGIQSFPVKIGDTIKLVGATSVASKNPLNRK